MVVTPILPSGWILPRRYTRGLDTHSLAQHMVYLERNAVKLTSLVRSSSRSSCSKKVTFEKINRKRNRISLEGLLSGETTLISLLRSQDALKTPCLRQLNRWESLSPWTYGLLYLNLGFLDGLTSNIHREWLRWVGLAERPLDVGRSAARRIKLLFITVLEYAVGHRSNSS
jgi:hypothetical protein